MTLAFEPLSLSLTTDETGEVWVEGTRVPLQYIVYEYRNGATAEDIAVNYPSLKFPDVIPHNNEIGRDSRWSDGLSKRVYDYAQH